MQTLLVLLLIGLLIWSFSRNNSNGSDTQLTVMRRLQQTNQGWINFIAGYAAVATTKSEKALLAKMLADIKAQRGGVPSVDSNTAAKGMHNDLASREVVASDSVSAINATQQTPRPALLANKATVVQLDNASLLLYFGAFLFVASAGLFVAFGNANGVLKAFVVLLVTSSMYASGVWLNYHRPKLRQAGQAFAGIGIVLAPLVGAALYAYAFDRQHGALIWLLTSLFCLGLYVHALKTFKTLLMGYILIFTILSLFESGIGVGVADVPLYYYGWGLAVVGIGLRLVAHWRSWPTELLEPSRQSSQLFLPLALAVSLVMIPNLGVAQLGISLLLAAVFYTLETFQSHDADQQGNAVAAQIAFTAGTAALVYGQNQPWLNVTWALLVIQLLQLVGLLLYDKRHQAENARQLWRNFGSVLLVTSLASVGIAILLAVSSSLCLATVVATIIVAASIWFHQRRADAYALASLAWIGLPYAYVQTNQNIATVSMPLVQAVAGLVALASLLVIYLVYSERVEAGKSQPTADWIELAGIAYGLGAIIILLSSAFTTPMACLAITVGVIATLAVLADHSKQAGWAELAAVSLAIPQLRAWNDPKALLLVTIVGLLILIGMSLRYRRELLRWSSTIVWLLLPYALGDSGLVGNWPLAAYAWAYIIAMVGLVLSRAIARGALFPSGKVPISSMMRSASLSYVTGYIMAALLALGLSLGAESSQLHTSLILALLSLVVVAMARYIERRSDILALLPLLLQALLLSSIRPEQSGHTLEGFLLLSSGLAVITYVIAQNIVANTPTMERNRASLQPTVQTALMAAFVTPAAILFADSAWPMPVGLLLAGVLICHYARSYSQIAREMAGGIIVAAILWFMSWAGVEDPLAYIYVIVAVLGLYAYWRTQRREAKQADNYLLAMLGTATVPLALQAISGTSGGLYGWWFLLEQVAIMLLGMSIKRRFVTMWGLYAAVAAVLYQLRGLGYAALAFLAIFLIGLAIYRLQKNDS